VLAALAAVAFPRAPIVGIGAALSALGAAIELVQGLPIVNRDCDVFDWVADTIGITCAFGPMALAIIRDRLRG
jgi:hypothetical protein